MRRLVVLGTILLFAVISSACGGSASANATTAASAAEVDLGQAAPSAEDAAASEAAAPAGQAGNAGALPGTACDLLTADEVEKASGQPDVQVQPTAAGNFDGESQCAFVTGGVLPVVIITVTGPNTNTDANSYLALPGSVRLSLSNADGTWVPAAGFVAMVIKHDRVVAVQIAAPAEGLDFQEVAAPLAQSVADRMP